MAIRITEDGTVIYENEPDVNRELFPNLPGGYASPEQIVQAVDVWLEEHPEATTTVMDGSITREKLDSELNSYIEDITNIKDTEKSYTDEGSFAYLLYETLGLYVDENGDICQREGA